MKITNKLFYNFKLKTKFLLSFLIIIFFSTILSNYFVFKTYEVNTKEKSIVFSQKLIEQLSNNMCTTAKAFEELVFLKIISCKLFNYQDSLPQMSDFMTEKSLQDFAALLSNSKVKVQDVYMLDSNGRQFYYNNNERSEESIIEYKKKKSYKYIKSNYDQIMQQWGGTKWTSFDDDTGNIYLIKSVLDIDTVDFRGVLCISIDSSYLSSMYEELNDSIKGNIVVYNASNNILSCNKSIRNVAEEYKGFNVKNKGNQDTSEKNGEKYIITGITNNIKGWKFLCFMTEGSIFSGEQELLLRVIQVCLLSVIVAILIAAVLSSSVAANISKLLKNIRLVGNGEFNYIIKPKNNDETGQLCLEFNKMSEKLQNSIMKIAFATVEKEKAEYNALQAQMNPHFLYNALESINSFAKIHNQPEITEIIDALSKLLRGSIMGGKDVITLEEELDYVKSYLFIQNIILGNRITIDYFIEPQTLKCIIPKLILQPIVENTIKHGVEVMTQGAIIVISAMQIENQVEITISDNGVGIEKDILEHLLDEEENSNYENSKETRLGIKSINRRMKILYGQDYGIKIDSDMGMGTIVKILIPFK